ncbi:MAG TPA: glycoside hydrolase family 15 protein [Vicinamibacterales bacterium]|nr:glycoside hydrolase family 15 protein [Vicinamibacterales bacterium]
MTSSALRIEDYGLIGDTQSVALVGRNGSIDWLCLPYFSSGACFAALLGDASHGRWLLAPTDASARSTRRYRGHSLVLETEFTAAEGVVRVVDFMPPRQSEPDLVRIVEGVSGEVEMQMQFVIRFDYGSIVPWVRRIDGVLRAIGGPDAVSLWSPVATHGKDLTTCATFTVKAGDQLPFHLVWHPSHVSPPPPIDAIAAARDTEQWWEDWCAHCTYEGEWREQVLRSLMTLKALTFQPTGGIVAAPTTSLPEWLGGVRNWDYRYCWLRDATFTLYSLLVSGYTEEAAAWRNWLLRAVAGDPADLQIMYGLFGERRLVEMELPWLPGYEGSKPVRIGNAAAVQRQLDVFGEVMDALYVARREGVQADPESWALQKHLIAFLEEVWDEPDEGIWEVRGPRRDFTHSKVMAWVAVDRAVRTIERYGADGPLDRWRTLRARIHDDICQKGFDTARGTFTQYYGSRELDASLLMIPLVGFLEAKDPRMVGTVHAIERELMRDGLLLRYPTEDPSTQKIDGLPPGEGAFLACTFWLADNYALRGQFDEARRIFEHMLGLTNDLGLLAEEYDPHGRRQLGNFPQAFSHVTLVNTAYNLSVRTGPAEARRQA